MNAQLMPVVSEPLPASRKVYQSGKLHPSLRVPMREIALAPGSGEPAHAVYDSSGPYTDPDVHIDIACGLPRIRAQWIGTRADVESYPGRRAEPLDDGLKGAARAAPQFPGLHAPVRARGGAAVTQLAYARAGIITPEMDGSRRRTRDHSGECESPRVRADDHRP